MVMKIILEHFIIEILIRMYLRVHTYKKGPIEGKLHSEFFLITISKISFSYVARVGPRESVLYEYVQYIHVT